MKKLVPRRKFDENFFKQIKDLPQYEKYQYLNNYLRKLNYNFESNNNQIVKGCLEKVYDFFNNRSKWKCLYKAKEEILRLNTNFKTVIGHENHTKESHTFNSKASINETEELRAMLRNISKMVEENENNSIFE
jgi:hypothetical protein